MNYLCLCGHGEHRHDWQEANSPFGEDNRTPCRVCPCPDFEPDDDRMLDLENAAKILRHDIERGK